MTDMIEDTIPLKRNLGTWMLNPFYYVAGGQALAIGLAFIVAAGLLGSVGNVHLDGVLDIHISGMEAPIWLYPVEGLINWMSMSLFLYLAGFWLSRTRFRVLDLCGTQALARGPALLMVAAAFIPGVQTQAMSFAAGNFAIAPAQLAAFIVFIIVIILAITWMVYLMYKGFSVSCNVSGGKAIGLFIVALILAEALSKTLIIGLILVALPRLMN